jgi:hypothetical protein
MGVNSQRSQTYLWQPPAGMARFAWSICWPAFRVRQQDATPVTAFPTPNELNN